MPTRKLTCYLVWGSVPVRTVVVSDEISGVFGIHSENTNLTPRARYKIRTFFCFFGLTQVVRPPSHCKGE